MRRAEDARTMCLKMQTNRVSPKDRAGENRSVEDDGTDDDDAQSGHKKKSSSKQRGINQHDTNSSQHARVALARYRNEMHIYARTTVT